MGKEPDRGVSRRAFLKTAGTAALAAGLWAGLPKPAEAALKKRKLGRTNYLATEASFGAIRVTDTAIVHAAIDRGMNLVHTCSGYTQGQSIKCVGEAMKTKRDKVFLALKDYAAPERFKQFLQTLQTDHVDAIMPPFVDASLIEKPQVLQTMQALKAQGLAKYFGFSCHKNMASVVAKATQLGCFDCALIAYSPANKSQLAGVMANAAQAGMGLMLMKWKSGGDNPAAWGPAFQTMIADQNVSCILCSAANVDQLTGYLQLASLPPREDEEYLRQQERTACAMCGACQAVCPQGVRVADIMRFRHYADRGDKDLALVGYRSLRPSECALNCNDCGECVKYCTNRLPVIERLRETHEWLA